VITAHVCVRSQARTCARKETSPSETVLPTSHSGLNLFCSKGHKTGYLGVTQRNERFQARRNGRHLGYFDTAVDAVYTYARDVGATIVDVADASGVAEEGDDEEMVMDEAHVSRRASTGIVDACDDGFTQAVRDSLNMARDVRAHRRQTLRTCGLN
jgi:hypothetical protein